MCVCETIRHCQRKCSTVLLNTRTVQENRKMSNGNIGRSNVGGGVGAWDTLPSVQFFFPFSHKVIGWHPTYGVGSARLENPRSATGEDYGLVNSCSRMFVFSPLSDLHSKLYYSIIFFHVDDSGWEFHSGHSSEME